VIFTAVPVGSVLEYALPPLFGDQGPYTMSDLEYARSLQEKFELYLLALVFTILGLAIQTAKLGAGSWPGLLEFSGWVALLLSGLVGLWRMEWIPPLYKSHTAEAQITKELADMREAQENGQKLVQFEDGTVPIADAIQGREAGLAKAKKQVKERERAMHIKYGFHKWLMVLGFVMLIASRGQGPIQLITTGIRGALSA
jgi:hypothetical protein